MTSDHLHTDQQTQAGKISAQPLPTAAILAGGRGTRLRSCVSDRPKVLAEVQGRGFLTYLLDQLVQAGFSSVVLLTGYLGWQVRAAFGDSYGGMRLKYSLEEEPLDTAGAVRRAFALYDSDPVLVMNGDSFCQVALDQFLSWHDAKGAEISIVLTKVEDTMRFGQVRVDETGRITAFEEKFSGGSEGWINAGIYLINSPLIETIPSDRPVSFEKEMFPAWVSRKFFGYCSPCRLIDIGTPESYGTAQNFFE